MSSAVRARGLFEQNCSEVVSEEQKKKKICQRQIRNEPGSPPQPSAAAEASPGARIKDGGSRWTDVNQLLKNV